MKTLEFQIVGIILNSSENRNITSILLTACLLCRLWKYIAAFVPLPHRVELLRLFQLKKHQHIKLQKLRVAKQNNQLMKLVPNKAVMSLLFGPYTLNPGQVFFESDLSLGIVNLKPIVPGHVLIIPKRVCSRFAQLTTSEVTDLFLSSHKISPILVAHYQCSALNIAIQDGEDSGKWKIIISVFYNKIYWL